jgi:hypothetical protein
MKEWIEDALGLASFYMQQGLYREASAALEVLNPLFVKV